MLIVTMAPLVLASLSIFWGALLARLSISRYALVYWAVSMLPIMAMHWMTSITQLVVLLVIASIGVGGWSAMNGELLKRLYPDTRRGLAFGLVTAGSVAGGALLSYLFGKVLALDSQAYTWFLPGLGLVHLAGVLVVGWLARVTGAERPGNAPLGDWSPIRMIEPVLHMNRVLKQDRVFFRYEAAFMTYGVGWMICWALVPLMITDKLKLTYDQASNSTAVPYQLAVLLMTLPAGLLSDRIGPVRTSAAAFALFTFYPALLIFTDTPITLATASVIHGVAAAAVNMGWLLGPVKLAPTPEKAPQYVAIHATLVGVRGAIFQALGVVLYAITGSFTVPLICAGLGFAWASWQMRELAKLLESRRDEPPPAPGESVPSFSSVQNASVPSDEREPLAAGQTLRPS